MNHLVEIVTIYLIMQQKQIKKCISHVDTSTFELKSNLASLKTEVDKLGIEQLVPVPLYLSKLSDVVKNNVIKKTVYDKLVSKVNSIDASAFVLKNKYDTDKTELENNVPDTCGFVKKKKKITLPKSLKERVKYQVLVV